MAQVLVLLDDEDLADFCCRVALATGLSLNTEAVRREVPKILRAIQTPVMKAWLAETKMEGE